MKSENGFPPRTLATLATLATQTLEKANSQQSLGCGTDKTDKRSLGSFVGSLPGTSSKNTALAPGTDRRETCQHGFTRRELIALAHPDERADLEATPEAMQAFAFALRLAEIRERGERPKHYTRAAFCEHCGPVWLFLGDATRVLGCPWCENTAKELPIPRPPVRCTDCRHWRADAINPTGGLGSCAIEAPASKRAGSLWPRGEITCGNWHTKTE